MDYKKQIAEILHTTLNSSLELDKIKQLIEVPKKDNLGDYAFPTFLLAKELHKAPNIIAQEVAAEINDKLFDKVQPVGPYVNFFMSKNTVSNDVINQVLIEDSNYEIGRAHV